MNIFLKIIAGILISVILYLVLLKQEKDLAIVLSITVCVMILAASVRYLEPVISFFQKLEYTGNLNHRTLEILLKASGIGFLSEITTLICNDSGNTAFGKTIQILASILILWMSVPLLEQLLTLLDTILGAI